MLEVRLVLSEIRAENENMGKSISGRGEEYVKERRTGGYR